MDILSILMAQLADPFRIGLLAALVLTTRNTAAVTGAVIPLLVGVVFVAVLIPTTLGSGAADRTTAIGVGLISNPVILGVILAAVAIYRRVSRP